MITILVYGIGGILGLGLFFVALAFLAPNPGEIRAGRMTQHLPAPNPRITASVLVTIYHHIHASDFSAAQEVIQAQMHWIYQNQPRLPGVFLQRWFRLRNYVTRAAGLQPRPQAFMQERCEELRVQSLQLIKGLVHQLGAVDLAESLPDWNVADTAESTRTTTVVTTVTPEREFRQTRAGRPGDTRRSRALRD